MKTVLVIAALILSGLAHAETACPHMTEQQINDSVAAILHWEYDGNGTVVAERKVKLKSGGDSKIVLIKDSKKQILSSWMVLTPDPTDKCEAGITVNVNVMLKELL